ncbi:hypothetical protein WG908_07965 [Sphingobium sp. AN641]|uniref:hypothetical protein n=1 Tax=Sphingobium sp. AN641 TaxID=3133443 RepID=UPI0030BFD62C
MRRPDLAVSLLLLLAACQRPDERTPDERAEVANSDSSLERAAIESGLVADVDRVSPIGLYQRRHEAGRDQLCIVPDGPNRFRFGMEVMFGANEWCRGRGTARRAGDKLIMRFPGDRCTIVAQYDGDRIATPGVLDLNCAALCESRGSLEGVTFPRLADGRAAAVNARNADGDALCGQ